jgi:TolA-binding protein
MKPTATSDPLTEDVVLARAAELVRTGLQVSSDANAEARARSRWAAAAARGSWPNLRRGWVLVPALTLIALLLGGAWRWWQRPLAYEVKGAAGPSAEGDYIAAGGCPGAQARVEFSDGTSFVLQGRARGRVVETHANGAEVALEDGTARLAVKHRPGARWIVRAGPFSLDVKGTTFDVEWSGASQTLEVSLHEGRLLIVGPMAERSVTLRSGERLTARLSDGSARISSLSSATESAEAAPPAPATSPHESDAVAEPNALAPPARSSKVAELSSWPKELEAGNAAGVVAAAQAMGPGACLSQCGLSDLVALADAARYTKQFDLARQAFEAQRKRFAGSAPAQNAALQLGRLADDVSGDGRLALRWYDQCLKEAPSGPHAADALGRKMLAERRVAGSSAAKQTAQAYLKRYPSGTYARTARELLSLADSLDAGSDSAGSKR